MRAQSQPKTGPNLALQGTGALNTAIWALTADRKINRNGFPLPFMIGLVDLFRETQLKLIKCIHS